MMPPKDVDPLEEQQRLYAGRFYRQTGRLPDGTVKHAIRRWSRRYYVAGLEARVRMLPMFTPVRMKLIASGKYNPAMEDFKHAEAAQRAGSIGEAKELKGAGGTTRSVREVPRGVDL